MSAAEEKRRVGEAAADLVTPGMRVGLGTGSTAAEFVSALARRNLADLTCVATSEATAALARGLGLSVVDLDAVDQLDLTIDGADEVGPELALIKGGGAALLREKLVWEASARCVVIADASKHVAHLGAFPLPIEVIAFGARSTARRVVQVLEAFGVTAPPTIRKRGSDPVRTDTGNIILDVPCGAIHAPKDLGTALKSVTGVVEHGLFVGLATEALISDVATVRRLSS